MALRHGADLHQVRPARPDRGPAGHRTNPTARDLVLQPPLSPVRLRGSRGLRALRAADRGGGVRSRHPACAVVSLAALDVRRRPEHRSELGSQLLLGEVVRILARSRDGLWHRLENAADGYRGWARDWGLIPASRARATRWLSRASARIVGPFVEASSEPGGGALVTPLFLNSRLIPAGSRAGFRRLELPDGRRAWVPAKSVVVGSRPHVRLLDRVRGLLGVPYLWGGRTALGFDCSGFTQQVLSEQGVALPRDAWQQ
ncbi:MAG: NlpC/P60 family protein, partial [Candidatus Eisenbacteria bacterium]